MKKNSRKFPIRFEVFILRIFFLFATSECFASSRALVADAIIDGVSQELIFNSAILVKDDRIIDIVSTDDIPSAFPVIRLERMTLMPGMINGHEHPLLHRHDFSDP